MQPEVRDRHGAVRTLDWAWQEYGVLWWPAPQSDGSKFALTNIRETDGPAIITVVVVDENGSPQRHQPIANHWPDETLQDLTRGGLKTLWHHRALVQETDNRGVTDFPFGGGSVIKDTDGGHIGGPHTLWVLSPSLPSDGLARVGWLGGTNHRGLLELVFRIVREEPQPPPEQCSDYLRAWWWCVWHKLRGGGDGRVHR